MSRPDSDSRSAAQAGVLLFNLGTPKAPEPGAVAAYLREFLSDPRVVDLPRWLWLPLLYLAIVPLRSRRSAEAYRRIWRSDGSPLLVYSERLAARLREALGPGCAVTLAMRYGEPSIGKAVAALKQAGVERLTVLPLYPQYSDTTTASGYDAVDQAMQSLGWKPPQSRIRDYHEHPSWIRAIAASIRRHRDQHGPAERLLFSMHGIPQRYVAAGDPYQAQCERSAAAVARELGLKESEWMLCYQSRFGRAAWLQPYTDRTLEALARDGVKRVQVVCPGFAVDCLETLEEVAMQNRELFEAAGGESLEYIPALNDSDAHVRALLDLIAESSD